MSLSTIEITEGIQERTSRIGLKKTMQAFGEVDACHMGDRAVMGDRFTEFPIVRFKTQTAAENALSALKSGQVFLDGFQLQGEWRGGGGQAVRQRKAHAPAAIASQPFEDTSSRMLWDAPVGTVQTRSTFAGRDVRRDDREDISSRSIMDQPRHPPSRATHTRAHSPRQRSRTPPRRRSRSNRRSNSRRRKHSRSRSHRKRGSGEVIMDVRPSSRSPTPPDAVSDNPLYRGRR